MMATPAGLALAESLVAVGAASFARSFFWKQGRRSERASCEAFNELGHVAAGARQILVRWRNILHMQCITCTGRVACWAVFQRFAQDVQNPMQQTGIKPASAVD